MQENDEEEPTNDHRSFGKLPWDELRDKISWKTIWEVDEIVTEYKRMYCFIEAVHPIQYLMRNEGWWNE